jgi:hypothetical protein
LCAQFAQPRFKITDTIEQDQSQGQSLCVEFEVRPQAAGGSGGHDAVRAKSRLGRARVDRRDGADVRQFVKFRFG